MTLTHLQEPLHRHFTDNLPDYLELLREMVEINSFTANPVGVNRLGRHTADIFADLGFTADTVQSVYPQYGKHLALTRPGRSGRTIGLVSHLDTVFPEAEEKDNDFHWRPEGDRIYGPGTVDIKGGTVLIYMMMSALAKLAPAVFDDVTWVVLLDASEEAHGADFGEFCLEKLGADALACLVFEGGYHRDGDFNIVVARKGMAVYHITVEGKAAHAGTAHRQGANAIVQLSDVIQQIKQLTDYERRLTFNVGTIAGGTVVNRVPHYASSTVEMRCFDPDTFTAAIDEMMALQEMSTVRSMADDYPCRVAIDIIRRCPGRVMKGLTICLTSGGKRPMRLATPSPQRRGAA